VAKRGGILEALIDFSCRIEIISERKMVEIPIPISITTSQGSFGRQICEGKKKQICLKQKVWKNFGSVKEGDQLHFYHIVRQEKVLPLVLPLVKVRPIHYVGEMTCVKTEKKKYRDFAFDDEFAKKEGFKNAVELRSFYTDEEEYVVIYFNQVVPNPQFLESLAE
jgi:hypothetical protein